MSTFISFNRKIINAEDARLPLISSAALYGKGIFTTVAVHNSNAFLWEKHWSRLIDNALRVGIELNEFTEANTKGSLLELINTNNLKNGRARLTFFETIAPEIWQIENSQFAQKTSLLIQTAEFRAVSKIFRLTVSPFRFNTKSPLVNIKSCNYLENILAFESAQSAGFDEAVRLNEKDEIVSACMANIFWKTNGEIFTPDLETGCLKGTTREYFLEKNRVTEGKFTMEDLYEADEIFLTSAGIGIVEAEIEI